MQTRRYAQVIVIVAIVTMMLMSNSVLVQAIEQSESSLHAPSQDLILSHVWTSGNLNVTIETQNVNPGVDNCGDQGYFDNPREDQCPVIHLVNYQTGEELHREFFGPVTEASSEWPNKQVYIVDAGTWPEDARLGFYITSPSEFRFFDGLSEHESYWVLLDSLNKVYPLFVGQQSLNWSVFASYQEAYERNGGESGVGPADEDLVHLWGGYLNQGFLGGDGNPGSVIIYNHNFSAGCGAYQVEGWILDEYMDLGGPDSWLQGPVSDEFTAPPYYEDFTYQRISAFEKGFISRHDSSSEFRAHTYYPEIANINVSVTDNGNDLGNVTITYYVEIAPSFPEADGIVTSDVIYSHVVNEELVSGTIHATDTGLNNGKRFFSATLPEPVELGTRLSLQFTASRDDGRVAHYPPDWYQNELWIDDVQPGTDGPYGEPGWSHPLDGTGGTCESDGNFQPAVIVLEGRVLDGLDEIFLNYIHESQGPLRDIEVILLVNGTELASTTTDDQGNYFFYESYKSGEYSLKVRLRDTKASPSFEILYGSRETNEYGSLDTGHLVELIKPLGALPPGGHVIDFNFETDKLELKTIPSSIVADKIPDLGLLYYTTKIGTEFYGESPFSMSTSLQIHFGKGLTAGQMWVPAINDTNTIFVDQRVGLDLASIWHELAHVEMNRWTPNPVVNRTTDCGNHGGLCNSDTSDSFVEGYALFMEWVVGTDKTEAYYFDQGPLNIWDGIFSGYQNEDVAFADLLWDLYDSDNGTENYTVKLDNTTVGSHTLSCNVSVSHADNFEIGYSDIRSVMRDNDVSNIHEFYDALIAEGYSEDDVRSLFRLHGFFEDRNDNCRWDTGEPTGYTKQYYFDTPSPRPNTPHPAKAYMQVVLEDDVTSAGGVIGKVMVDVINSTGALVHTYQIPLLASRSLIPIPEVTPYKPLVLQISIAANEQESGVVTVTSKDFWRAVNNVKVGYNFDYLHNYLGEYTFVLGDSTPIPFDASPPTSTVALVGTHGNAGWLLTDPVSITLTSVDELVGTAKIEYSFNATEWLTYTQPFTATHDDTVYYRATDWLDNVEPTQQVTLQIDTLAPTSTLALSPSLPYSGTFTTDVTALLSGGDSGPSGLDYVEYRLNGGAWLEYDETDSPIIAQNGPNILEYRAVDVAGNVEEMHSVTITLDKTVHTLVSLNATQANRQGAMRAVMNAFWKGETPLIATETFSVTEDGSTLNYPAGTVILQGEVGGNFTRNLHVGPLEVTSAQVLYAQSPAIFNSASSDERASWEQLEIGRVLEDALDLPDWPRVNEHAVASDTVSSDVLFIPAGVTADVQRVFEESGAAEALLSQVQKGRWVVCQGDGCLLAQQASLVPTGTVNAGDTLPVGSAALLPVEDSILGYNWPADMELTRYSDTPRFTLSGDLVRVADYADNGETAIVLRRVGRGGVILIGGHASADESSYGLLYHALFTAGAEQVSAQVSVEQQFMPGVPPDVVPGLEPNIAVLIRTQITNYDAPVQNFQYTELITTCFRLVSVPTVTVGTVVTAPATTSASVWLTWTAELLPSGAQELVYQVANVATDTLKAGAVTVSEAGFSYTTGNAVSQTVQLNRPAAIVRALLPSLIAHNPTEEPDNTYPLAAEGFYHHIRHEMENKLETRANNLDYTVTIPLLSLIQDAFDQTIFPTIKHYGWYRPIVITDVEETHAFVLNTVTGYPERDYPIPMSATEPDWAYSLEDWDGLTWVRIPNPRHTFVHIPIEYREFIRKEPNNGDLWVPGVTLTFEPGTMLAYDQLTPPIRYLIHSQELFGRGVSFSVEPITDTLVLEGNGGSVYTGVGQHPIPFREYFPDAAINNPIAPAPSQITYTDLWGRTHTLTETVRSSFYDIIPYPRTGEEIEIKVASTYGMHGEDNRRLPDVAASQVITVTYMIKAESLNRSLAQEQLVLQELLPRGLGYDIEFISWESSNGSFVLLDEYSLRFPAFELLSFQGALPENEPQTLLITARLRTYPDHVREGSFLIDGGARFASPVEIGGPGQYDTGMTHVRVEQGYEADPEVVKRIAEAQVPRQGGLVHEIININALADIQRYREEVYVDGSGTVDKAATVRVGGSWGKDLYFATVEAGGETYLVYEITNNSGSDWSNVDLDYNAPPGITLTPIFTDGLEPPPNVYDTPYLWATEIPDIARGVYYYKVHVDESVTPGVMYPIAFTMSGDNVPSDEDFPLPIARVGVGGEVHYILGQTQIDEITDRSPEFVTPTAAALATTAQMMTTESYTTTEQWTAFFDSLTTTVPFTHTLLSDSTRLITYTIPSEWQVLPQENHAEMRGEWTLLVQTEITATEPGYHVVNYGPQMMGVDSFDMPLTAQGNPGHVTVSGPALTGTYTLLTTTSPFYGGVVIDPLPGEVVDAWVDIAIRNVGNRIAETPEISATFNLTGDVEILDVVPEPVSIISNVVTWQVSSLLPYGAVGDGEQDMTHLKVQLRFTPPDATEIRARLAQLETSPFYMSLIQQSVAEYAYSWGNETFWVTSPVGGEFGLHIGSDPLSAPDLYSAVWNPDRERVLLQWTEVVGAKDYVVYRSREPDRNLRQVGWVTNGTSMESRIFDDPLAPVYYYIVRARDASAVEGRHSQVVPVYTSLQSHVYLPLVIRR